MNKTHGQIARWTGNTLGGLDTGASHQPPDDITQAEEQQHLRKPERTHAERVGKFLPGIRRRHVEHICWRRTQIGANRRNGTEYEHIDEQRDAQAQQAVFYRRAPGPLWSKDPGMKYPEIKKRDAHEIGLIDEHKHRELS